MQPLMTPGEVAELLQVSQRKAYALKDEIGYVELGGNVRFERDAVEAYIERCKRSPRDRGETQWESRSGTVPPGIGGLSPKRVSAADIKARLQQNRRQKSTPRSDALN